MAGREDALRVVDVLQRERDPVKRAPILAGRDLRFRRPRLPPGQVERGRDEGARLPVIALDALDQRLGQLGGRELARRDQSRELGDRQVVKFRGHGVLPFRR
jgi:hypothetical protein